MRKFAAVLIAAVLPLATLAAGQSPADPPEGINHMIEVAAGKTEQVSAAGGTGGSNLTGDAECDSASVYATCEKTLALMKADGTVTAQVTPKYPSDYNLDIWLSDETGALVEQIASSENLYSPATPNEEAAFDTEKGAYYVFIVKYFAGGGGYFMNVGLA